MNKDAESEPRRIGRIFEPELARSLERRSWNSGEEFSCANAWNLLVASYLAYGPRSITEPILKNTGFANDDGLVWVENGHDVAFVASDGTHAVVAARGSDDIQDWWDNLHVGLSDAAMGRVHGGIIEAVERLWSELDGAGLELAANSRYLWLAGHSRGALIMTEVAARWRKRGVDISGLYTFGSPRIGDEEFREQFEKSMPGRIHRVHTAGDWMADMPPNPPYEHVHVGTPILLPVKEMESVRYSQEEKERRLKAMLESAFNGVRRRVLGLHMPRAYFNALRDYCD